MPDRKRPNIILFLTDDHGRWANGCYGNSEIRSPSIDYLARTGVRMDNATTPSPVCSPARACFFTGRLPSQHGIHDWIAEHTDVGHNHPGLHTQTTLNMILQREGYFTCLFGKWHCGHSKTVPLGLDRFVGYAEKQYPHRGPIQICDNGRTFEHDGYQHAFFAERAMDFLRDRRRDRSQPFFMTVGLVNTHTPHIDQPPRLVESYDDATFADISDAAAAAAADVAAADDDRHGFARFKWPDSADQGRDLNKQYYAAVTAIDEQVGRVIDQLEAAGEREDTLIIYTSDHGHMNGQHGLWTKGNATIPQNFLNESIDIPMVISMPGTIPAGQTRTEQVNHCDLFATCLDAAQVTLDEEQAEQINSPGRSFLPQLKNEDKHEPAWRDATICEYGNARMIRTETDKLIVRYPGPNGSYPDEYYDLKADPAESENHIHDASCADRIAMLRDRLDAYFVDYEITACSGREIDRQPRTSVFEPWWLVPSEA